MTNWLPNLETGVGPLYVRLADSIETAIGEGELPPGSKLPPQRNLAFDIGVTIGTVGRAYSLVRERGLVSGEVGRGTYVLNHDNPGAVVPDMPVPPSPALAFTSRDTHASGKILMDSTSAPDVGQGDAIARLTSDITTRRHTEVIDYTRSLPANWLEAGRTWLSAGGWQPEPGSIVPTVGAHSATLAIIAAITAPGDRVAFEELTYSSLARSAGLIGRRCASIRSDGEGAIPEDVERVFAQLHPKVLFLMPTLQNPTLAVMSQSRRREIAELAQRFNVWLIEDSIYGALTQDAPTPLAALAPDRTFHVGGLSKSVAAGIRAGWIACPPHFAQRVMTAHKMITGGLPFLLAEVAAELVLDGEADAIRARVRTEIAAREAIAREHLAGQDFISRPDAPFLWLKLPDPWHSGTFRNAAAADGVLIDEEDEFKPGRTDSVFHRVRIGFSAPNARNIVRTGFEAIRRLLDNAEAGYDTYS